ncbi:MAG TPA: DUF4386 domain-containing protein [Candidatus Cybelea sp.]|jgi:hypothetical protein
MMNHATEVSPQVYARIGGWLYLLIFIMAVASMLLQSGIVVSGDAAATAAHLTASVNQWRLSIAADLVMFSCDIPLAALFFVLLRPVNAGLSLVSAGFRFAEAVIGLGIVMLYVAPLLLLGGAGYLEPVDPHQLQVLALLSIKAYDYAFGIALIPFGIHCVLLGYLIFKSTYLPKTLGVLMVLAGAAYVINSFALFIAPALTQVTFNAMLITALPAELGICLWLIVFGVNLTRWNERVRPAAA